MKKTAMIAGTLFLLFTGAVYAQTDSTAPVKPTTTSTDKWNNYDTEKYKLLPMPEPLTLEKTFPVIGKYEVTAKTHATTNATVNTNTNSTTNTETTTTSEAPTTTVSIMLDETNKGIVWVEGLPQGKIKAMMRKAPGTYKIPAQKTEDGKDIAEGVLIYDKDANMLDVCIGCTYNAEDPASAFAAPAEPMVEETVKVKTNKSKSTAKTKTKVTPVKTWKYSGSKVIETTASSSSVVPMQ